MANKKSKAKTLSKKSAVQKRSKKPQKAKPHKKSSVKKTASSKSKKTTRITKQKHKSKASSTAKQKSQGVKSSLKKKASKKASTKTIQKKKLPSKPLSQKSHISRKAGSKSMTPKTTSPLKKKKPLQKSKPSPKDIQKKKPTPQLKKKVRLKATTKDALKKGRDKSSVKPAIQKSSQLKSLHSLQKPSKSSDPIEAAFHNEQVILTNAEGQRFCHERECDQPATVDIYCRKHYVELWDMIKRKEDILKDSKLQQFIKKITERYPDKFLEMIRRNLSTEREFTISLQELDIIEGKNTEQEHHDHKDDLHKDMHLDEDISF